MVNQKNHLPRIPNVRPPAQVDEPQITEMGEPSMKPGIRDILCCSERIIEGAGKDGNVWIIPFHLRNMAEQSFFIRLQTLSEMNEVGTLSDSEGSRDIVIGDDSSGIPFGIENGMFQKIDADPEIAFFFGEIRDAVEDDVRNHAGIKAHADTVMQNSPHLLPLVAGKGDLFRLPDGDHCRVKDHEGRKGMVADGGENTGLYSRIVFVHPEEGTDNHIELVVVAEVVGVVQTDNENRFAFDEFLCDGINKQVGMNARVRRLVSKKPFKDDCKDPAGGVCAITVDKDRHHALGSLLKFAEYSVDAGGLTGPRRAAKVGVDGACSLQGRA